jgi:hypothetical protein
MAFSKLIQRTPRRVVLSFVFAYGCTLMTALLSNYKAPQMF